MKPEPYQSLKRKRTFEIIVDLLKKRIFSGEYTVGDRLPSEREFAEMIEVSRSAVREAYHALEILNIVEIRKGTEGGAFIREPSHRPITQSLSDLIRLRRINLQDMTEARLFLEKDLAQLALKRATKKDIEDLQLLVDQSFERIKAGESPHRENVQFHLRISEISRNQLLMKVYASVMELHLLVLEAVPAEFEASKIIAKEHIQIIQLLKDKEIEKLIAFVDKHIQGSTQRLMKRCKNRPEICIDAMDNNKA